MRLLLLGLAILGVGLNLRVGVASVGPVLAPIQGDLGISESTAGLLVSIPVLSFGVFAFATPPLSRSIGMYRLLLLAMVVVTAGTFLRLSPSAALMVVSAVLIGAGVGVGNVLVPVIIKEHFARNAAMVTGLYVTLLFTGAALASGLTAPLFRAFGNSWTFALGVWGIPAAFACIGVFLCFRNSLFGVRIAKSGVAAATGRAGELAASLRVGSQRGLRQLLRFPSTWYVTGFMCLQSINYYVPLTWLPKLLADAGVQVEKAGWLLAFSAVPAIGAAIATPLLVTLFKSRVLPMVLSSLALMVALAGMIIAPVQGAAVWMIFLGASQGSAITLSLCLIVWQARDSVTANYLSTFAQGVGYVLASVSPFIVGLLFSELLRWTPILLMLLAGAVLQGIAGVAAIRSPQVKV